MRFLHGSPNPRIAFAIFVEMSQLLHESHNLRKAVTNFRMAIISFHMAVIKIFRFNFYAVIFKLLFLFRCAIMMLT